MNVLAARLFPFPPILFRMAGKVLGQSGVVDRLLGSLVVDSSKIQRVLSWRLPYGLKEGLEEMRVIGLLALERKE